MRSPRNSKEKNSQHIEQTGEILKQKKDDSRKEDTGVLKQKNTPPLSKRLHIWDIFRYDIFSFLALGIVCMIFYEALSSPILIEATISRIMLVFAVAKVIPALAHNSRQAIHDRQVDRKEVWCLKSGKDVDYINKLRESRKDYTRVEINFTGLIAVINAFKSLIKEMKKPDKVDKE